MMQRNNENHKAHDPKLEKQIQDEIYRRVKEKEKVLKDDQLEDVEERATVEAIEEFTELPDREVEQIAREVRSEFSAQDHGNLKSSKKIIRFGLIAVGIIFIISIITLYFIYRVDRNKNDFPDIPEITYGTVNDISYRAVFTTKVDGDYQPVDAINKIPLNIDVVYLYITWQNLSTENHKYRIRAMDGVGTVVWDYFWEYTNKNLNDNTWLNYKPKIAVDKPGRWQFEVYIDGIKMFEKFLMVESS
jgi:hypothetical protein